MSKNRIRLEKLNKAQNQGIEVSSGKGTPANRRALLLASSPLLLMAAACVFAVGQRQVMERLNDKPFGLLSRTEAKQVADEACTRLTGETSIPTQATYQSAYSDQRGDIVREWDVICSTPGAQYLLRINADTRRVYAVNRLTEAVDFAEEPASSTADETAAEIQDMLPRVSRQEAEQQAKRYLGMMGVPAKGLKPILAGGSATGGQQWNFTFQRNVPGKGSRLLKVSIDGHSGALEHLWNPVLAL